jgi:SHS2 domain-containing protein
MKKYEQFDISGDVGLRIRGKNLEELFTNTAEGMSALITDLSGIRETEVKEVVLRNERNEDLLVKWLNELIFLFDAYGFIGKRFDVSLKNDTLRANISGGIYDPAINESRLLVKAATYHGLSLEQNDLGWEAVVVFDI